MGSLNVNSLVKHIDELRVAMINQPLDILAINESKLDDNDSDNMLSLHRYTPTSSPGPSPRRFSKWRIDGRRPGQR